MIKSTKPLNWFDEMNLRYVFKRLIASVFGVSQAYLVVTESSYSAMKAMQEFNEAMKEKRKENR